MTLKKREKILALASAALLAVLAFYYFWPSQEGTVAGLREELAKKQSERDRKKSQAMKAAKVAERLAAWQRRALPANTETARSMYKSWLLESADRIFTKPKLTAGDGSSRKDVYTLFNFELQCQGTLEQLTKFLHEFYSASHLHKIRLMTIKPAENSIDQLDLKISIEAMSLSGSTQKDKLSQESYKRLKLASLDEYKKIIVGRNLFAAYAPPKPPRNNTAKKDEPKKVDPLQFSYLTAIVEADGVPEAWLFERTTGETLRLHVGEEFTIGKVHGKLTRIGYNDIDIEVEGQNHTVGYGNNLKNEETAKK